MSFPQLISDHIAEVVFLLFKIGESMLDPSVRLYLYEGVCLEMYGSKNITDKCTAQALATAMGDSESRESAIQAAASNYLVAYKFLMNAPALVLGFFCGSWSDSIGRKIPILLSLVATTAAVLLYTLSMFVDATGRGVPAIPLVLAGALIRGGVGRAAVITMALYSLVCDQSSRQNRTKKIGRLLSMSYFGYFIGSLTAGALLEIYGFDIIFTLVLLVDVVCIILVLTIMDKEEPRQQAQPEDSQQLEDGLHNGALKSGAQRVEVQQSWFSEWSYRMMPFKWIYVINSIQVLTRKRHHRTRLHLLVFIFTIFVHQTCKSGEMDVTLLFAEAAPLSWRKSMYGYLLATDYALLGVSVLILLPLLIRLFKLSDANLVLFGLAFRVARLFALSMSKSTFEVFFSTFIGCPSSMIVSACKAKVSKMVGDNERGKAFALMSCAETVAILVGSVIFSGVYRATRDILPGMVFIFEALFFLAFIVVIWFVGQDMKKAAQYEEVNEIAVENLNGKENNNKNETHQPITASDPNDRTTFSNTNRNPFCDMEVNSESKEFSGINKTNTITW